MPEFGRCAHNSTLLGCIYDITGNQAYLLLTKNEISITVVLDTNIHDAGNRTSLVSNILNAQNLLLSPPGCMFYSNPKHPK